MAAEEAPAVGQQNNDVRTEDQRQWLEERGQHEEKQVHGLERLEENGGITVCFVDIVLSDDFRQLDVKAVLEGIKSVFLLPVNLHVVANAALTTLKNTSTRQTLAESYIALLQQELGTVRGKHGYILGITGKDLSPHHAWSFVFGYASPVLPIAVLSVSRLLESGFAKLDQVTADAHPLKARNGGEATTRVLKVARHELGHLFGLDHCESGGCRMKQCSSVEELDEAPSTFCAGRFCNPKISRCIHPDGSGAPRLHTKASLSFTDLCCRLTAANFRSLDRCADL